MDPFLTASLARQESAFDPDIHSSANASPEGHVVFGNDGEYFTVTTPPESLQEVRDALEARGSSCPCQKAKMNGARRASIDR